MTTACVEHESILRVYSIFIRFRKETGKKFVVKTEIKRIIDLGQTWYVWKPNVKHTSQTRQLLILFGQTVCECVHKYDSRHIRYWNKLFHTLLFLQYLVLDICIWIWGEKFFFFVKKFGARHANQMLESWKRTWGRQHIVASSPSTCKRPNDTKSMYIDLSNLFDFHIFFFDSFFLLYFRYLCVYCLQSTCVTPALPP